MASHHIQTKTQTPYYGLQGLTWPKPRPALWSVGARSPYSLLSCHTSLVTIGELPLSWLLPQSLYTCVLCLECTPQPPLPCMASSSQVIWVPVQMLPPPPSLTSIEISGSCSPLAPYPDLIFTDMKQIYTAVLLIKKHNKELGFACSSPYSQNLTMVLNIGTTNH